VKLLLSIECFFSDSQKGISRIKAPFLTKELQSSSYNLTGSDYTTYRGGLYSPEEGNRMQENEFNFTRKKEKCPSQDAESTDSPPDVDFVARIAFIVAFALFNFFYWIVLIYVI